MPGMYELPSLPMEAVENREPVLRIRHSITNTNYYVQVYSDGRWGGQPRRQQKAREDGLRQVVPNSTRDLLWVPVLRLRSVPLTGLARKILQRLGVMESARMNVLE
jgi:A/G-specific adenine glycosylase